MGDLLNLFRVLIGKRFPFQFVYSNEYWMVETGRHVFPLQKYRLVYESLLAMGAKKENFLDPGRRPMRTSCSSTRLAISRGLRWAP